MPVAQTMIPPVTTTYFVQAGDKRGSVELPAPAIVEDRVNFDGHTYETKSIIPGLFGDPDLLILGEPD